MNDKQKTGAEGESRAVAHLRTLGYKILETNWRFGQEEIDIIAQDKDFLVVAEVKTRSTNYFGEPEAFVNKKKQAHLIKAANAYVEKNNLNVEVRFDIVSVLKRGDEYKINVIQNAFYPLVR